MSPNNLHSLVFVNEDNDTDNDDNSDNNTDDASESSKGHEGNNTDHSEASTETVTYLGNLSSPSQSSEEGADQQLRRKRTSEPKDRKTLLASAAAFAATAYAIEKCRQKKLTKLPLVMGQIPPGSAMKSIYGQLTRRNNADTIAAVTTATTVSEIDTKTNGNGNGNGILNRPIVPSFLVGTHGGLASAAAYFSRGPSTSSSSVVRFSETLVSSYDGAEIHLDWEVPRHNDEDKYNENNNKNTSTANNNFSSRKGSILAGTLSHPTVVILHGINNSSSYGYIRSLQRAMTNRGWNAVAVNFRGCAQHSMTTPRSYTACYTGDLRSTINQLAGRTQTQTQTPNGLRPAPTPLVLVGNSLGANLVTKYLGEEGLAGTLPPCVVAGVSLGNPFAFPTNRIRLPFSAIMGVARKAHYFSQRKAMAMVVTGANTKAHSDPSKITLEALDRALAPTMVRNASHPPYETLIGYGHTRTSTDSGSEGSTNTSGSHGNKFDEKQHKSSPTAADAYWDDSSCYRQGRHVSIPLLHVVARDDSLCYKPGRHLLGYSLSNPNVLVVQTRTGGHLGWWHTNINTPTSNFDSDSSRWGLKSWADDATADFIQAVLHTRSERPSDAATATGGGTATAIDDAHNLFATTRIGSRNSGGNTSDRSTATGGTGASMRALSGECDDDSSTIATNDPYSYDHSNYNNSSRSRSSVTTTSSSRRRIWPPRRSQSQTYFQFQEVLVMQQQRQRNGDTERNRGQNRLREKRESVELARAIRSRL